MEEVEKIFEDLRICKEFENKDVEGNFYIDFGSVYYDLG